MTSEIIPVGSNIESAKEDAHRAGANGNRANSNCANSNSANSNSANSNSANRESEDIVEHVAMPLFDLRDSTLHSSVDPRRGAGADPQSQILLPYAGCETGARVFSTAMVSTNALGLFKFLQAMSSAPALVGVVIAVQAYFLAFVFDLVRVSPSFGLLFALGTFFITFCAMFYSLFVRHLVCAKNRVRRRHQR